MLFSIKPLSHCPGVRPGTQFVAGGPRRTGTNREGSRVRSYIPGSALGQKVITVCPGHATVYGSSLLV